MSSKKVSKRPLPKSNKAWLQEIADAYVDALGVNAFAPITETVVGNEELFHLAPSVCLKFRGMKLGGPKLKTATEAALTSYVATKVLEPELLSRPHIAFAFCYMGAHFGLDLVDGSKVERIMDFVVDHENELLKMVLAAPEG